MSITVSDVASLVGRYTNSVLVPQTQLESEFVSSGALTKITKADKLGVVNIKSGGFASTAAIADAGSLPAGDEVDMTQLTYQPKAIFARMYIPRQAAELASSKEDGIDLVFEQMESVGRDLGRTLGRLIFDSSIGSPHTTGIPTADSDTSFQVTDPSGFRNGMSVSRYNAGGTFKETFRVKDVALGYDGANSTITTVAAVAGATGAWATTDVFYLGHEGSKDQAMTSMADVTAAASLYGQSQATYDWRGQLKAVGGAVSNAVIKNVSTMITRKRGKKFSHLLCNALNEQRIYEDHVAEIRYTSGKMDEYGMKLTFDGRPIVTDENIGDGDIYLHQKEDVKLHCFREFAADTDGAKKGGYSKASVQVSADRLVWDCQFWGSYNLRVERRSGTGRMSGITG